MEEDRKFHGNRFNGISLIFFREKRLIEFNYDFLNCSIRQNQLICEGFIKPTEFSIDYKIRIVYDGRTSPKVYVLNPTIEYNDDIHMFSSDKSLCLYHSEIDNFYWKKKKHHLYDTIIPWSIEWFVYYEIYLISGKWEHPYIEHRKIENPNRFSA